MIVRNISILALIVFLFGCSELQTLRTLNQQQEKRIKELDKEVEEANKKLFETIQKKNEIEVNSQKEIEKLEKKSILTKEELTKKEEEYNELLKKNQQSNELQKIEYQKDLSTLQSDIQVKDQEIERLKVKETEAADLAKKVQELEQSIAQKDTASTQLTKDVQSRDGEIKKLQDQVAAVNEELRKKSDAQKDSETKLAELNEKLKTMQGESEAAKQVKGEIEKMKGLMQQQKGLTVEQVELLGKVADELKKSLEPEIAKGGCNVIKEGRKIIIRISNDAIYEAEQLTVKEAARPLLTTISTAINQYKDFAVTIEGHSDNQPIKNLPYFDNLGLSSARADNLLRFFAEDLKVPSERMKAVSCSSFHPIATNDTPEGRAQNRRVEIVLNY